MIAIMTFFVDPIALQEASAAIAESDALSPDALKSRTCESIDLFAVRVLLPCALQMVVRMRRVHHD